MGRDGEGEEKVKGKVEEVDVCVVRLNLGQNLENAD